MLEGAIWITAAEILITLVIASVLIWRYKVKWTDLPNEIANVWANARAWIVAAFKQKSK